MSVEVENVKPFRFPQYTFGCEMECLGGRNSRASVVRELREAGFTVANDSYTERYNTDTWVVGYDGSVNGPNGLEIKSPILKGAEGFRTLMRFTKVLNDLGIRVDRSCGLHVHIGITNAKRKFRADEVHTILKRYQALKPQIDLLLAKSRRSGQNSYCADFSESIKGIEVGFRDERIVPHKVLTSDIACEIADCGDHYDAVSVESLGKYGTIEFRQHHGTVNGTKITNWIRFLLNFIEMSRLIALANRGNVPSKKKGARSRGFVSVRRALAPKREVKVELPKEDGIFVGQTVAVIEHFKAQKERLATGTAHTRRRRTVAQAAAAAQAS